MRDINKDTALNRFRIRSGPYASIDEVGNFGMFCIPHPKQTSTYFIVLCSDSITEEEAKEMGVDDNLWEHVSVHVKYSPRRGSKRTGKVKSRCPTWIEMDYIKRLFFEEDEVCFQLHVPHDQHINCHPYTLHIWRHETIPCPTPPPELVGPLKPIKHDNPNQLTDDN